MERLIALQLWLHQQWIGDDRWDVGFGIHTISEIPCACWWAWQCFFSSFYTQNFPLLVYLRTDKDNCYTCMYILLLFEKKSQIFPGLFPLLPPTIDQPSPPWGNIFHAEGMHCVGAGKCSGVTPGGRQQLSQKYCGSTGLGALSKERVERQFFCFWLLTSFRVAVLFSSGLFVFTGCPLLTLGLFSLPCNTNILRR